MSLEQTPVGQGPKRAESGIPEMYGALEGSYQDFQTAYPLNALYEPPRPEGRELIFNTAFAGTVGALAVVDVAYIPPGRNTPRGMDGFTFIPLTNEAAVASSDAAGRSMHIPDGVRATYDELGTPYFDTSKSIGLVKLDRDESGNALQGSGWLVAVASAGLDNDSRLVISQLQDVSGWRELEQQRQEEAQKLLPPGEEAKADPKARFRTGLYDGFAWRETFVAAWENVARDTGIADTVIIQSAANSPWDPIREIDEKTNRPRGYKSYDQVAENMDYKPTEPNGNWVKELRPADPAL